MSDKVRKHKERASRYISKGKYDDALDEYLKAVKIDPRDLSVRQKLAETYGRMGKTESAIREYQSVAGAYAADGLLLKAIAINKVILNLDPSHTETQGALAGLYARKRGDYATAEPAAVAMPAAMNAARGGPRRATARITGRASREEVMAALEAAKKKGASGGPPPVPVPDGVIEVDDDSGIEVLSVEDVSPAETANIMSLIGTPSTPGAEGAIELTTDFDIDITGELSADVAAATAAASGTPVVAVTSEIEPDAGAEGQTTHVLSSDDAVIETDAGAILPRSTGREPATDIPSLVGEPIPDGPDADVAAPKPEVFPIESNEDHLADLGELDPPSDQGLPPDEGLFLEEDDDGEIFELEEPAPVQPDELPPIPLFSDLSPQAFITFTERMGLRPLMEGEMLIEEGESGSSMFIVVQGRVKVVRQGAGDAPEIVLAQLSDGAFFGEMALLSEAPRTASVIAVEDTMVFEITRDLLDDMVAEHPSVELVMKRFHKNRLLTNLLRTSPVFAPFSAPEKKNLIEKFKSRAVDPGEFILTRDKPGDGLYVVLSGRCEVSVPEGEGDDAKEVVLAELRDGDVFGEMSMLFQTDASASVRAKTPAIVLRLPKKRFQELIMTHPQVLETLSTLSEARLSQNVNKLGHDAPPDEDILADFLL